MLAAATDGPQQHSRAERILERLVAVVIAANCAIMVCGLLDAADREWTERAETACLLVFLAEVLVRLHRCGWRPGKFLVIDLIIVALALALAPLPVNASLLRLARIGRAARFLHLFKHLAGLRAVRLLRPRVLAMTRRPPVGA